MQNVLDNDVNDDSQKNRVFEAEDKLHRWALDEHVGVRVIDEKRGPGAPRRLTACT